MNRQHLEALRREGYAPATLLDVGAHIGTFARGFLEVFPDCVPTLIEPNPFCEEALEKLPFERHAVAASDQAGKAMLFLTKEWLQSTGSSLYRENTAFFRDEVMVEHEVDKARIDDLFAGRRFDFVKIDTQGSELDVLRGGQAVLAKADYVLLEVSLVEYNLGGAKAEAVFAQMAAMGFKCADVTEFHRLRGVQDGALLQIDVLFERRGARVGLSGAGSEGLADVLALAERLLDEGRYDDALVLFGHAVSARPLDAWIGVSRSHMAAGRVLQALQALAKAKPLAPDIQAFWPLIQAQSSRGAQAFNLHLANNDIAEAQALAAAMVELTPGNAQMVAAAMSCNQALDRVDAAIGYARALIGLDPGHVGALMLLADQARRDGEAEVEIGHRVTLALSRNPDIHPLVRLRDFHDSMSLLLCRPLSDPDLDLLETLAREACAVTAAMPDDSEWIGWVHHYQALLGALDIALIRADPPLPPAQAAGRYRTATGQDLDDAGLQALAERLDAKTVFFAAADPKYVELYGRWYALSVLRHCDVSCLVVIHVIGGGDRLAQMAQAVGVADERLIFVGDDFDAAAVTTRCYDAPPKGLIALPVAHFQSVRFQRLGDLLATLGRPVFVSDIDLLLQRGVSDLLDQWSGADVVFNENTANIAAGSRITANLLLVNPTAPAQLLLSYLRTYLDDRLGRDIVTRWIDQVALILGRHHLTRHAPEAVLGCFDTTSDINNVMFETYQEHPFRFLSLYHGFDTSSLENDPRVLGGEV